MRIGVFWNRIRDWCRRGWAKIRPGPEARKGAAWGAVAIAVWAAIVGGLYLESGFGLPADFAFAFAVGAVGIPLIALLIALLLTGLRKLPRLISGLIFGVFIFVGLAWAPPVGLGVGAILLLVEGVLGATIATFLVGHFREAHLAKKIITVVLCLAAVAANVGLYVFLSGDGNDKNMLSVEQSASPEPPALSAPNPAEAGALAVKTLFYGSGSDIRRPEYASSVAIRTPVLDASKFFKDFKGWKANLRRRYWGFGMDKLPLNGRVWYPDGAGPFPLVLIVHGNHTMSDFSDPGYEYLGELLASRGFILVSIDENFLNGGLFHEPPKQQAVRGWMLLEHLKLWHQWSAIPGNPFYGKVDLANVALMGHSRGGEAVATAALFNSLAYYPDDATIRFDYGFPIKSIVAIAPVDGQYKPAGEWRTIENVNYLTFQGANDADVSSFNGSRQWDHLRYTGDGDWFKAELYIYRANHGQFNTRWGRSDVGEPLGWLLNMKPLMSGEDQRRISKTYISAFLEATLHGRHEYVPLFRDYRAGRGWLPRTFYMSRYLDASYRVVSNFSEDPDVTTTTVPGGRIQAENLSIWREGRIPYRQGGRGYNGVFLGWNREGNNKMPSYTISLPEGLASIWKLSADSALTLSLAVTDEKAPQPGKTEDDKKDRKDNEDGKKAEPTDFTLELETTDGVSVPLPLSRFGVLMPPFKVRFSKLAMLDDFVYNKSSEPAFQTVEAPLEAFGMDPARLKAVRLRFDRTPSRVVILSQIGFVSRDPKK